MLKPRSWAYVKGMDKRPLRERQRGLYVSRNGRDDNPQSWHKFLEQVSEAAMKQRDNRGRNSKPSNMDTLPSTYECLWAKPIPLDRRCDFEHRRGPQAGNRCKRWAMKGATRCNDHGGYRQNPQHPSTIKKLQDIADSVAEVDAAREIRTIKDAQSINTIREIVRDIGAAAPQQAILDGVKALQMDDNGRAYRRWQRLMTQQKPTRSTRARKKTLKSRR